MIIEKCKKFTNLLYISASLLLLVLPFAADALYRWAEEYCKHTFTIQWKYISLYTAFIVLGLLLPLQLYSYLNCSAKRIVPALICIGFAAETVWLYYTGFFGSFVACFLFVSILIETVIPKSKA
ncbi:MAG: hypothetical protein PUC29_05450 [Clostridia bacterium]|nr:hypothetical protein [Clostridia bacterium]